MLDAISSFLESPALSGVAGLITISTAVVWLARRANEGLRRFRPRRVSRNRPGTVDIESNPDRPLMHEVPYWIVAIFLLMIVAFEFLVVFEIVRKGVDLETIHTRLMLLAMTGAPWALLFLAQVLALWIDWGLDEERAERLDLLVLRVSMTSYFLFCLTLVSIKTNDWFGWP